MRPDNTQAPDGAQPPETDLIERLLAFAQSDDLELIVKHGEAMPAPIGNYYGTPALAFDPALGFVLILGSGGLELESRHKYPDQWQTVPVSADFARVWIAEFGGDDG